MAPRLSEEDIQDGLNGPRRLLRAVGNGARAAARRLGRDLIKRNYYSPVPHLSELPADYFERPSSLLGIELGLSDQLEQLRSLRPLMEEFDPPDAFSENPMYGPLDSRLLFALIRSERPRRVVELGSGFTSYVIARACERNESEAGHRTDYVAYDPYPRPFIREAEGGLPRLEAIPATEIALEAFTGLEAGDMLFIDTTHTVKMGSEVNWLILEVLPRLRPGVSVHFHDIFLPYPYPRAYLEGHLFWAEQDLLQAFLAFNPQFQVRFSAYALHKAHPAEIEQLTPSPRLDSSPHTAPISFWIRRT